MRPINQKELAVALAEKLETSQTQALAVWKKVSDFITEQLVAGKKIRIKGTGVLKKVDRPAKECRVPNSDRTVHVPARFGFKLSSKSYAAE